MFQISGPAPVGPIQTPAESNLFLRVNQRVAGEILKVSNDQVVLSVQGVQIVARLTTPDQTAILNDRRYAMFIVRDLSNQVISLQLADTIEVNPQQISANQGEQILLDSLLNSSGLIPDASNRMVARALINRNIPVTPENISQILKGLQQVPQWGQNEADLAATLRAMGVPINSDSVNLLSKSPAEVTESLSILISQLQQISNQGKVSPVLQDRINDVIRILSQGIVEANLPAVEMQGKIKSAVTLLGKSLEYELLHSIDDKITDLDQGLMTLASLRTELASKGFSKLAAEVDRFNDYLRLTALMNNGTHPDATQNQWFKIEIPFHYPTAPGSAANEELHPAKIKIAREEQPDGGDKVDPHYTRIVIQMDLDDKENIEVDLSVVNHQAGLNITTSSKEIARVARAESENLRDDLAKLGYDSRYIQVDTAKQQKIDDQSSLHSSKISLNELDIEA